MMDQVEIAIGKIKVGELEQRLEYSDEDIGALAVSISRLGLIYPLLVKTVNDGFLLVEGHRRLAACKKLGKDTVRCCITEGEDSVVKEIAFAGNYFRKDLSSIELAASIWDALENGGMSIEQLAEGFSKKPEWVRRMVAILTWPSDVQQVIHERLMSVSAASNLALIEDDTYRDFLLKNAVLGGVTARTTASWLQAWRAMQPVEEAVTKEPVSMGTHQTPMVPQAPCFCCAQQFNVDQVSHVPVCSACIQILRKVGGV